MDPPRLRGAGGTPCLPRAAAPTSGGIGEQKQSQTSRVVWGEVGEDLRRRDTGEPQRPPLSLRAAERPGQRQDAAAGTPEPRGRSLRPPRRLSSQAPARGHRAPRSPAARSLRTWPAAAAAAAALLLTYPFRTSPFATQLFARTGRRRQQQPPGSGRIVPAAPRRLQADALCRRRPRERPPRSAALRPSRLPETGNGCTPPPLPCGPSRGGGAHSRRSLRRAQGGAPGSSRPGRGERSRVACARGGRWPIKSGGGGGPSLRLASHGLERRGSAGVSGGFVGGGQLGPGSWAEPKSLERVPGSPGVVALSLPLPPGKCSV